MSDGKTIVTEGGDSSMLVLLNPDELKRVTEGYAGEEDTQAIAEWFATWSASDDSAEPAKRVLETDQQTSFFLHVLANEVTVVGVQEFPYSRDNTIEREYWIWDHHQPHEYVIMHVHFSGSWREDELERKKGMRVVTSVNLRHSISADQSVAKTWYHKNIQMSAWREMEKSKVEGLPRHWRWEGTGAGGESVTESSLAIKKIMDMAGKACKLSRSVQIRAIQQSVPTVPSVPEAGVRNFALIMAVGDYMHHTKLPNAVRDGEILKNVLHSLDAGWEVEFLQNPTKVQARKTLAAFDIKFGGVKGAAMVTFVGHGFEDSGSSYFFLKDSNLRDVMADGKEIDEECISTLEVCDKLKWPRYRSSYPTTLVIFDCCRTHIHLTKKRTRHMTRKPPTSSYEFENLVQIFSTSAGNQASDGKKGRNWPFMEEFHRLIQQPGLELSDLMKELTHNLKGIQLCKQSAHLTQNFFFVPKSASASVLGKRLREDGGAWSKVSY